MSSIFFFFFFFFFFFLATKLIGPHTGYHFFLNNVDFSDTYPLKAFLFERAFDLSDQSASEGYRL